MGGPPFRRYAQITQKSYRARTTKQLIRQTCSNEKAEKRPAEGRNGNCQPALSIGLDVFWNCELFVLIRFFYLKK